MKIRKCTKCGKEFPANLKYFFINGKNRVGLRSKCKNCHIVECKKLKQTERYKKQAQTRQKKYYAQNKELYAKRWQRYYRDNREKLLKKQKEYCQNNREKIRIKDRKYREIPLIKLNDNFSRLIRQSLFEGKNGKHWENLVDYNLIDLKIHIEKQFKDGMSWNNYGEWHIDHIQPVSSFVFNSYGDIGFEKCWALENLQPLWAEENMRKSNKVII